MYDAQTCILFVLYLTCRRDADSFVVTIAYDQYSTYILRSQFTPQVLVIILKKETIHCGINNLAKM